MRKRKKPKESWLQRAIYEIENADYLLALRNLELKLIRKEKRNMAWTKITQENYKEVEYLLEHEFPIMFACKLANNKGFHYGHSHDFASCPFEMALMGCFYYFAMPKP